MCQVSSWKCIRPSFSVEHQLPRGKVIDWLLREMKTFLILDNEQSSNEKSEMAHSFRHWILIICRLLHLTQIPTTQPDVVAITQQTMNIHGVFDMIDNSQGNQITESSTAHAKLFHLHWNAFYFQTDLLSKMFPFAISCVTLQYVGCFCCSYCRFFCFHAIPNVYFLNRHSVLVRKSFLFPEVRRWVMV